MRTGVAALVFAFAPACVGRVESELELGMIADATTKLIVFALGDPDRLEPTRMFAIEPPAGSLVLPTFAAPPGGRIEAITFPYAAAELQIPTGVFFPPVTGTRELPSAGRSWTAKLGPHVLEWTALDAPGKALAELRLPELDPNRCALDGGCYELAEDPLFCKVPCKAPPQVPPPAEPAPPAMPAPVALVQGACSVYRHLGDPNVTGGIPWCDYDPLPESRACAVHEAQLPHAETCTRIGTECPAGGWPVLPSDPPPIYVRASAPAGGDGSQAMPYRTIAAALDVAELARPIALYAEPIVETFDILRSATITGACAERSVIRGGLRALAPGVVIRNLRVEAIADRSVRAGAGSELTLEGVVVSSTSAASAVGIASADALLTLADVSVRGFRRGGIVTVGSTVTADRVAVRDAGFFGVHFASSEVDVHELAVRDTANVDDRGIGLLLTGGTSATVTHATIERSAFSGIQVQESDVRFFDTFVVDTVSTPNASNGVGLSVTSPSSVRFERGVIDRATTSGVTVASECSARAVSATIADALIADTRGEVTTSIGYGVQAVLSRIRLERTVVLRNTATGITMRSAELSAEDVAVADMQPALCANGAPQCDGTAVSIGVVPPADCPGRGADSSFERLLVRRARTYGMFLVGAVSITDATITDTFEQLLDGNGGIALMVAGTATATIERVKIERAGSIAVRVDERGRLHAVDVELVATGDGDDEQPIALSFAGVGTIDRMRATDGRGICAVVQTDATSLEANDFLCARAREGLAGVLVQYKAGMKLTRGAVEDIDGVGVIAEGSGDLRGNDLAIRDARGGGLYDHGAFVDLRSVEISRTNVFGVLTRTDSLVAGQLSLGRVKIAGTKPGAQNEPSAGIIAGAFLGPSTLDEFEITGSETRAALIEVGGSLAFENGYIADNAKPICIANDTQSRESLMVDVTFELDPGELAFGCD